MHIMVVIRISSLLLTGLIAYLIFLVHPPYAAAQRQSLPWELSLDAEFAVWPLHDLYLLPLPAVSMPEAMRPRFTVFLQVWESSDMPLLTAPDFLSDSSRDVLNPASQNVLETTFERLPLLAWVNYRASNALQLQVSRFVLPASADPIAALTPLALPHSRLLSRQFTVAEIHGTWLLAPQERQALHYALYAGVLAEDTPDALLVGARIGYSFGIGEFTVGIDYLYHNHAGILAVRQSPSSTRLPQQRQGERDAGLPLFFTPDTLLVGPQRLQGLASANETPLAVHARPVLHINRQWTVFYRFDHLSIGPTWPKITEHAFGVRFLPVRGVYVRAEFLMSHCDNPSIDAEGFRLSGTIRF